MRNRIKKRAKWSKKRRGDKKAKSELNGDNTMNREIIHK